MKNKIIQFILILACFSMFSSACGGRSETERDKTVSYQNTQEKPQNNNSAPPETDLSAGDSSVNPTEKERFDETFWCLQLGQTLGATFDALFHKDGTFTARCHGSGLLDDGTYTFENGTLTIDFWRSGSDCVFHENENGFISDQKYEMQVGEDYYYITPIEGESIVYYYGVLGPSHEEPVTALDGLPDGEYYGLLTSWTGNTMTVEYLQYEGVNPMSQNLILKSTGQMFTYDITQAAVSLDAVWNNGEVIQCDSIDDALDTEIWGGPTKLRDASSMRICFVLQNASVKQIVFPYVA